jgi:hypothetical protein
MSHDMAAVSQALKLPKMPKHCQEDIEDVMIGAEMTALRLATITVQQSTFC